MSAEESLRLSIVLGDVSSVHSVMTGAKHRHTSQGEGVLSFQSGHGFVTFLRSTEKGSWN